jgi:hypothetical protein
MSSQAAEPGMAEFVAWVKFVVATAFADAGEIWPTVFIDGTNGKRLTITGRSNAELSGALYEVLQAAKPERLAFAAEVWASQDPSVRTSQAADRDELVVLYAKERGAAAAYGHYPVARADSGQASLGDFVPATGAATGSTTSSGMRRKRFTNGRVNPRTPAENSPARTGERPNHAEVLRITTHYRTSPGTAKG